MGDRFGFSSGGKKASSSSRNGLPREIQERREIQELLMRVARTNHQTIRLIQEAFNLRDAIESLVHQGNFLIRRIRNEINQRFFTTLEEHFLPSFTRAMNASRGTNRISTVLSIAYERLRVLFRYGLWNVPTLVVREIIDRTIQLFSGRMHPFEIRFLERFYNVWLNCYNELMRGSANQVYSSVYVREIRSISQALRKLYQLNLRYRRLFLQSHTEMGLRLFNIYAASIDRLLTTFRNGIQELRGFGRGGVFGENGTGGASGWGDSRGASGEEGSGQASGRSGSEGVSGRRGLRENSCRQS